MRKTSRGDQIGMYTGSEGREERGRRYGYQPRRCRWDRRARKEACQTEDGSL